MIESRGIEGNPADDGGFCSINGARLRKKPDKHCAYERSNIAATAPPHGNLEPNRLVSIAPYFFYSPMHVFPPYNQFAEAISTGAVSATGTKFQSEVVASCVHVMKQALNHVLGESIFELVNDVTNSAHRICLPIDANFGFSE
jgi:hypothetical protein